MYSSFRQERNHQTELHAGFSDHTSRNIFSHFWLTKLNSRVRFLCGLMLKHIFLPSGSVHTLCIVVIYVRSLACLYYRHHNHQYQYC